MVPVYLMDLASSRESHELIILPGDDHVIPIHMLVHEDKLTETGTGADGLGSPPAYEPIIESRTPEAQPLA